MPLLSVFTIANACTNHTVTHSAGQRHPLPGSAVTGAFAGLRPRSSLMASQQRETQPSGSGRSTEVEHLRRSLPLPRLVLSPRTGRDLEKRCALYAGPCFTRRRTIESPLAERDLGHVHVAKTTDTHCRFRVGAHLRRHVRPSNRGRGGQSRHDPTPVKPPRLLVATAPVIPRKPTDRASPNGF